MQETSLVHQVSCSVVLAAALTEFFPQAQLKCFKATEKCFFCDLILPFPFEKEVLPLLEERMRVWVKKNIPFQFLEMMPGNAANFLDHHGYPTVAERVRQEGDLVQIVRLDQFAGRASGKPLEATGKIKFFKLSKASIHGSAWRILGTSAFSKEGLKFQIDFCKKIVDHLHLAKELQLFSFSQGIWLPRGEKLKALLSDQLLNLSGSDPISSPALEISSMGAFHASYCQEKHRGAFECVKQNLGGSGDDLLDPAVGTADRISLPLKEGSIISFLQIITQFFKIIPFDPRVVIVGKAPKLLKGVLAAQGIQSALERGTRPGVEFRLNDSLGREWTGPRIWVEEKVGLVNLSFFTLWRGLWLCC